MINRAHSNEILMMPALSAFCTSTENSPELILKWEKQVVHTQKYEYSEMTEMKHCDEAIEAQSNTWENKTIIDSEYIGSVELTESHCCDEARETQSPKWQETTSNTFEHWNIEH